MRTSARKTTAAILRAKVNEAPDDQPHYDQSQWAELLGCSVDLIKSVEAGRVKLSQSLAGRMSHECGVSQDWLLAGNVADPPVTSDGFPYTRADFEYAQRRLPEPDIKLATLCIHLHAQLHAILSGARSKKKYRVAVDEVHCMIGKLRDEFGDDPELCSVWGSTPHSRAVVTADMAMNTAHAAVLRAQVVRLFTTGQWDSAERRDSAERKLPQWRQLYGRAIAAEERVEEKLRRLMKKRAKALPPRAADWHSDPR